MSVLFGYFLFGLSLSAPIGPINAAQLDMGLKRGFAHAWLVGIGAMCADILYMLLVYFGFVHFVTLPFVKTFLWLFGSFVLLYTGFESLFARGGEMDVRSQADDKGYMKTLLTGFLMSLSNPMTIMFWLGIYGSVLAERAARYEWHELAAASAAMIAGIMLWDFAMALLAATFRRWLTPRLIRFIAVSSGLSLIGFGAYFGFKAFGLLFG
ncbi:LysE family transporter [Paenibacillus thailandensis]|uniref:LysE family transporter n=1 Tax=Paenibacillus thailandensis TaxID=393250 RepID=A0ABW5QUW3_9BACL